MTPQEIDALIAQLTAPILQAPESERWTRSLARRAARLEAQGAAVELSVEGGRARYWLDLREGVLLTKDVGAWCTVELSSTALQELASNLGVLNDLLMANEITTTGRVIFAAHLIELLD